MVSRKDKLKMRDFVCGRIEDAGRYNILEAQADHLLITQRNELVEQPREAYIFLHNDRLPIESQRFPSDTYPAICRANIDKGRFVSDMFYKDGEMFFVRLAERGNFKGDYRSLKRYTKEQIDRMIHLRGLEKKALEWQRDPKILVYFQPKTAQLEESIRGFRMDTVMLDYSHVRPGDSGYDFVRNGPSIDYKLTTEVQRITAGAAALTQAGRNHLLLCSPDDE